MDWSKYYPANYTAITADDVKMIQELKRAQAEDNTNNKADDGEGLDKVQPKALKKKFDKRKDTDIDNDGDTDDSDEFIHTKRKAISKAIDDEEEEEEEQVKEAGISYTGDVKKKDDGPDAGTLRQRIATLKYGMDQATSPETKKEYEEKIKNAEEKLRNLGRSEAVDKEDLKDASLKKKKKDSKWEEPDFSKNQDTVTNMEWAKNIIHKYHKIDEHCGWCEQGITNEKEAIHELSTSKDIAKQIKELAKAVRGKDRISLEGASKFVEKKQYDKLAAYLDSMAEEARQSVLMVLMNDQKIANLVMKKMKTEEYDICEIPSHKFILSEMYRKYQGLTWGEIGERLIKNTERRLVSLAYATKLGTIDAPSPEVQKLADECELEDLEAASKQFIEDDSDLKEDAASVASGIGGAIKSAAGYLTKQGRTQKALDRTKAKADKIQKHKDNLGALGKEKTRLKKLKQTKNTPSRPTTAKPDAPATATPTTPPKSGAPKPKTTKPAAGGASSGSQYAAGGSSDKKPSDPNKKKPTTSKPIKKMPDMDKHGTPITKKGSAIGALGQAVLGASYNPEEPEIAEDEIEVPERLDARRKIFREKIKKLAYEKAREILGKKQSVEPIVTKETKDDDEEDSSKVKETGKVVNKVKMNPEEDSVKESTGVAFVRKYKNKINEVNKEDETSLQDQILELFRSSFGSTDGEPAGAEFAVNDEPASASSIARMLRCSPTEVQKLLDDMVEAGQITRVGDAYSYASPRAAEPMGVQIHGPAA